MLPSFSWINVNPNGPYFLRKPDAEKNCDPEEIKSAA
jgi:hypothetical protein